MTTKEQIKEEYEELIGGEVVGEYWNKHWNFISQSLDKQKERIKKSLPTHPDKMLSRKEVIDIINRT